MDAMKKTIQLIEDENGELILPLDDEIFTELGLQVGDRIKWTDNGDGSWTMSKIDNEVNDANA